MRSNSSQKFGIGLLKSLHREAHAAARKSLYHHGVVAGHDAMDLFSVTELLNLDIESRLVLQSLRDPLHAHVNLDRSAHR
jgi:hypothetical protein